MRNERTGTEIARGGDVVTGFVPEIREVKQRSMRGDQRHGKQREQRRCFAGVELGIGCQSLVHRAGCGTSRIKLDLAECAFVVRHILVQDRRERLGLLRAQINSLKVSDFHLIFGLLLHGAEDEKKIPDVDPHLDAVGVGFPVINGIDDVEIRLCGNHHKAISLIGMRGEGKSSFKLPIINDRSPSAFSGAGNRT